MAQRSLRTCAAFDAVVQENLRIPRESGSCPLVVIVERDIPYTAYGHDVGEVKHVRHVTGSHACLTLTRTARPSRHPRRRGGTPGVRLKPHLWRHAWRRGLGCCKGSYWRTLAWRQGLSIAWGAQEAMAEEIQTRTAKHLAFQHLQTIDVPLDWAKPRHDLLYASASLS